MPAPPRTPPVEVGTLDEQILRVEQRLTEREQRFSAGCCMLGERFQTMWRPQRWMAPLLGVALVFVFLGRLFRRREAAAPAGRFSRETDRGAQVGQPWIGLLVWVWPLLPAWWRSRINPGTAGALLSFMLSLLRRLKSTRAAEALPTVEHVDLHRLAGPWYEIDSLPSPCGPVRRAPSSMIFRLLPHGEMQITRAPLEERDEGGGKARERGTARAIAGSRGARWRVSFAAPALRWLPGGAVNWHVLHLDGGYNEMLIGTSDRKQLWLLGRQPRLPSDRLRSLLQMARERGFAVERWASANDRPDDEHAA
jgi:apolipoprotein D and lipocalin family protein